MGSIEELSALWKHLYQTHLPALAAARDPVQKSWPVHLDHCFARIVLDNALGIDGPWTEVVKSPAIKHMNATQMESVVDLAQRIATGEADLAALDQRSLELRGKKQKRKLLADSTISTPVKRKKSMQASTVSSYFLPSQKPATKKTNGDIQEKCNDTNNDSLTVSKEDVDLSVQIRRISDSDLTSFRKQTLTLLCQIPRGRYSTYGAMSDYISKTSHKTCARAVGNAMRNNPFAPEVPCHRVLAGDGSLGGFKGSWGEEGKYAAHKHELLHEEGVRFDSTGKVKGPPFRGFT